MDPRVATILRYTATITVIGIIGIFILKFYRHHRQRAEVLDEFRSLTSESSFYRQFYPADAERTLLRLLAVLRESELDGVLPSELLDKCFGSENPGWFESRSNERQAGQQLVRQTLMHNYENCRKLGLFVRPDAAAMLRGGELPPITVGPASGKTPVIVRILDPSLAPGLDKVVANLEIRPPDAAPADDDIPRTAAARRLAHALAEENVIDSDAVQRIEKALKGEPVAPAKEPPAKADPSKEPTTAGQPAKPGGSGND